MELLIDGIGIVEVSEAAGAVGAEGAAGSAGPVDAMLIETMRRAADICIRGEGIDPQRIEISLSFVSPEEIHELNREHRGVDRVTDVLSFPLVDDLGELPGLADERSEDVESCDQARNREDSNLEDLSFEGLEFKSAGDWTIPLGDVVICLDRAEAQAEEYGHSREREIVYLFVHSMLHLLGYDHMEPEEQKQMRAREEAVMQAIDLPR